MDNNIYDLFKAAAVLKNSCQKCLCEVHGHVWCVTCCMCNVLILSDCSQLMPLSLAQSFHRGYAYPQSGFQLEFDHKSSCLNIVTAFYSQYL